MESYIHAVEQTISHEIRPTDQRLLSGGADDFDRTCKGEAIDRVPQANCADDHHRGVDIMAFAVPRRPGHDLLSNSDARTLRVDRV